MMPKVDLQVLNSKLATANNQEWNDIVALVIKKDGSVRSTKPKLDKNNPITGKAAYVWRFVVFTVSKVRAHQCMPCTADFDLPAHGPDGKWSSAAAREMAKELHVLESMISGSIDKREWHGIARWGKAFGMVA